MDRDKKPQAEEPESVKAEQFLKVYCNSAQIEVNPWDFRLIFGEVNKSGAKLVIEQSVAVIMSPQHAKAFLNILASNLSEYEKQVGVIPLPGALQEPAESD